jgi:methylated-DNA-[protein]-cysteine S-methyltransferase
MSEIVTPALDERFRAAAAAEGLLDVAYDVIDDTPIGALLVGVTDRGVCRIWFDPNPEENLETLARLHGPRVLRASAPVERVRRELDEYFEGRRHAFDLAIDWSLYSDFGRRVLQATAAIPFGRTASYGDVAAHAGNPKASRAAGRALGANAIPIVVPCHRVIGTSGKLTGYTGGMHRKEALLRLEGIAF